MRQTEGFVKLVLLSHFPFPPHSILTIWHGIVSLSLNIDPRGERGGQLLFCKAEVKELLSLPIVVWLSHYILSKNVVI